MVCVALSDQTRIHGAVPVSAALIVAELPAQIAPLPLTVAVGSGLTVTVAEPLEVPVQSSDERRVGEECGVAGGLTLRERVGPLGMVGVTLSDQITIPGA